MRDFVDVTYDPERLPFTTYPAKLARYLFDRYNIKASQKLLDIGCGRGEFLGGFLNCGVKGFGVDRSRSAEKDCPQGGPATADLETEGLPFEADFFDVVYSKSVFEHFYYPERLVAEIYRVLKPGGLVVSMVPDWEFN